MTVYDNILLISGTGRNVGKTTLACMIIDKFRNRRVTGLKISPHWHDIHDSIIVKNEKFLVVSENNDVSGKDSSRFLRSGAAKVLYVQAYDENLSEAFSVVSQKFINGDAIVCESASLASLIKPALHLRVTNDAEKKYKEMDSIPFDRLVVNENDNFAALVKNIDLIGNKWILKND
jgi:hypothetical protein